MSQGLGLVAALFLCAPFARASDLTSAESCRACHAEAYRIWSQGPHARAAQALPPEQKNNQLCLYCHSRDESRAGAGLVSGVSCETCHGGGRYYQTAVVMRDKELAHLFGLTDLTAANAAASCLGCHGGNAPSLRPFDVKEALARIDHWSAERAARRPRQARLSPHGQREGRLATWLAGPARAAQGSP